jgi:hypothetical protein
MAPAIAAIWLLALAHEPGAAAPQAGATPPEDADIAVHVVKNGASIVVDVDLPVNATALETWNVMTDYDNMARFVTNLESSAILSRDRDKLVVAQKGKASRGPFTFAFENVREIVLTPYTEIRSRLISGNLEASEFTTRVFDHGTSAQIVNHGEFIPKVWVPPLIGTAVIEAETRKQFQELRAEILRRKAQTAAGRE